MSIEIFDSLASIAPEQWDALTPPNFPFAGHAFLLALETSRSVGPEAGWRPFYLTVRNDGRLEGALYAYLKDNSYGEYIFDWAWLQAYHEHGVPYFPKLVCTVPFTPATGPKFLVHPAADTERVRAELIEAAVALTKATQSSSLHVLFPMNDELPVLQSRGFLLRHSYQFHWSNHDYRSFTDFLSTLKPRKRKQIMREREQLSQAGVAIHVLEGEQLTAEHAETMYRFYLSTTEKMGAIAYLTKDFFQTVFREMKQAIVLMLATVDERPVAGAIHLRKGDSLFGRYWGCDEEVRNLHFELCYYQGIEYAISKGLRLFEAGAQGEHKVARGFLPRLTYSAHWLQHPVFRDAIGRFIENEKSAIAAVFDEWAAHLPYKD